MPVGDLPKFGCCDPCVEGRWVLGTQINGTTIRNFTEEQLVARLETIRNWVIASDWDRSDGDGGVELGRAGSWNVEDTPYVITKHIASLSGYDYATTQVTSAKPAGVTFLLIKFEKRQHCINEPACVVLYDHETAVSCVTYNTPQTITLIPPEVTLLSSDIATTSSTLVSDIATARIFFEGDPDIPACCDFDP
jgi:hypothetical protein